MLTIVKKNDSYDAITYQLENEDNSTVDLTGASVNFVMGKKNKLITNAKATVTSATSGIVSYQLTPLDTLVSGTFLAEFVVTFANGAIKTYPSNGYITVDVEQNLDTSQANVVVDMIAEKQGDFTSKLNSILQQAGNINMSAMNEYSWTATEGQLIFIFPSSVNYTPSTKWFQVSVGNVPVDNTLVNRSYDNQFALNIDSSNIKAGMTVRAMWVEPITPVVPNSYKIIPQQDLPPVDAGEGDLWFDTSDNTYQGTIFNDLNTRVSNNETSLATKANQADFDKYRDQEDFVQTLKRHTKFKPTFSVSCKTLTKTEFSIVHDLYNGKSVEYNTGKSSIDGYTRFQEGKIGVSQDQYVVFEDKNYDSKTGTWVTTSTPNIYTTQVGATLTLSFFGSGFDFNFFGDNRGGVWRFVIDGDTANPIDISTFRTVSANSFVTVKRGLTNANHTLVATFQGADPLNAPSGGTARGWSYEGTTLPYVPFKTYKTIKGVLADTTPLFGDSNKEFAINMRKNGTTYPYYFTPLHGVTATAVAIEPTKFIVDGVEKTFALGEMVENVTEFQIVQKIYGKNPETENHVKITTVTTFKSDGTVNIDGRMEALVDLDIESGFGIMFPVGKPFSEMIISSIQNKYLTNRTDGYVQYLSDEKDLTTSFVCLSSANKSIGVACTFENAKLTLRQGKTGKNTDVLRTWIEHRDTTMSKFYQQVFKNAIIPTGDVFRFSGTFFIGNFNGLYELFNA
jgi:hypothetical protein